MRLFSRRAYLIGVASIGGGLALGYLTTPEPPDAAGRPITCPFLAMNPPDTTNMWTFARGCARNGMAYGMALFVTAQITYQQKGLWAILRHEAPDIYRLRQVPGVSHEDRFAPFQTELRAMAEKMAVKGRLTLHDLVTLKEWVARKLSVVPNEASRIETALLFVRAGGNLDTWTVDLDDVFRLVAGQRPLAEAQVTVDNLTRTRNQSKWSL
ncbi:MAG: hypothetical protein K2X35_22935 [Bryobacteraceae bacterium]|nr:hypothetical protein [Bryobacteraceae bacterium]